MRLRLASTLALSTTLVALGCGSTGNPTGTGGGSPGTSGTGGTSTGTTGTGAGGATTGTGGSTLSCAPGTGDCDENPANGCEADTTKDPTNCGVCGNACGSGEHGMAACKAGLCALTCDAGFSDCDADPNDGCEIASGNDPKNCGTCGHVCADGPSSKAACQGGTCGLACPAKKGDCNHDPSDDCESNLDGDPKNCGACGTDCMGAACVQGACACATATLSATLVPLDLYIMLDQSASMDDALASGGTKWTAVTSALQNFFAAPTSAGIGVGIQYFALPDGVGCPLTCNTDADCGAFPPCFFGQCIFCSAVATDSCTAADYAKPEVEIAPLDASHASSLTTSMANHAPSTDTPTGPALQGAVDHAHAWGQAHPSHVAVTVLATDGDPTECSPQDIPGIATIAAAGLAGSPSVKTFVIGVGPSLTSLNSIAASGGTNNAFLVDTGGNVVQQFQAALAAIQHIAVGCQYSIPQPATGQLDFTKINVQYTPSVGAPQLIGNATDQAACGASGGWYYDDNANPTKIILCPSSCTTVDSDNGAKVDVVLGCKTVLH